MCYVKEGMFFLADARSYVSVNLNANVDHHVNAQFVMDNALVQCAKKKARVLVVKKDVHVVN